MHAQLSEDLLREALAKNGKASAAPCAGHKGATQQAVQTARTTIQHACVTFVI